MLNNIKYVVQKARFVKINHPNLNNFVSKMNLSNINNFFDSDVLNKINNYEKQMNILFIFGCMNFRFWTVVDSENKDLNSSNRDKKILKIINNLITNNKTKSLGDYLDNLSLTKFAKFFYFIPYSKERWQNVQESGLILRYRFKDSFINLLKEAGFDALKALSLIIKFFPSFDDRAVYDGREVEFHKRAQILLYDIANLNTGFTKLKNIDKLIGGADYKIPQLLRHLGILKYSKDLEKKIDNKQLIAPGTYEEIEIRASTLVALDIIKAKLNKKNKSINTMKIDRYLWILSKKIKNMKPHHRTISFFY